MKVLFALLVSIPLASYAESSEVSKGNFEGEWPLTVDGGTLDCQNEAGARLVTITSAGKTYALNGTARGKAKQRGWSEVDSIWKDNPEVSGLKINIGPLVDFGLSLCS